MASPSMTLILASSPARFTLFIVVLAFSGFISTVVTVASGAFFVMRMAEYPYRAPTSRIREGFLSRTTLASIFPFTGPIEGMKDRWPISSISRSTLSAGFIGLHQL